MIYLGDILFKLWHMILVGIMKIFYDIAVCVSYRVDRRKRNTLHNRKKIIKNQKRVNFVLEVDISRYKFNASDFNFKKKNSVAISSKNLWDEGFSDIPTKRPINWSIFRRWNFLSTVYQFYSKLISFLLNYSLVY